MPKRYSDRVVRGGPVIGIRFPVTTEDLPGWASRMTLLIFVLGSCLLPMHGYQSVPNRTSAELVLSLSIMYSHGANIPGVAIDVLSNEKIVAHAQTGEDGKATVKVRQGLVAVSIHQPGFIPIHQLVDMQSMSELEIRLDPLPQAQETVNVQASNEDITEQTSSPATSIKAAEANESPLRPLTLTDALPLVPGVVLAPNGQTQIAGAGEMHSALVINSVDTVDPATGRFGLSVPIDVVDSLHVLTSPYLAQYGRFTAGVVTAKRSRVETSGITI